MECSSLLKEKEGELPRYLFAVGAWGAGKGGRCRYKKALWFLWRLLSFLDPAPSKLPYPPTGNLDVTLLHTQADKIL